MTAAAVLAAAPMATKAHLQAPKGGERLRGACAVGGASGMAPAPARRGGVGRRSGTPAPRPVKAAQPAGACCTEPSQESWKSPEVDDLGNSPQEAWNSVTMLAPMLVMVWRGLGAYREGVPFGFAVMAVATAVHLVASFWFHASCAMSGRSHLKDLRNPLRVADIVFIHNSCFWYGCVLSDWNPAYIALNFLANSSCAAYVAAQHLRGIPGTEADSDRVIVCLLMYTSAMVSIRGDTGNYAHLMASYAASGVFWKANGLMRNWGHGFFHLCLAPAAHFLMAGCGL